MFIFSTGLFFWPWKEEEEEEKKKKTSALLTSGDKTKKYNGIQIQTPADSWFKQWYCLKALIRLKDERLTRKHLTSQEMIHFRGSRS